MDAVVARETYSPQEGRSNEWVHPMPSLGEIVVKTRAAQWYLAVTDDGNLQVRAVNLPTAPAVRVVVKADSSNLLTLEARYLGS